MTIHTVADEIYFRGYRVAILTTDVPATVMGDFEDGINNATLFESVEKLGIDKNLTQDEFKDQVANETVQAVWETAKGAARGGLLNLKEFRKLLEAQGNKLS